MCSGVVERGTAEWENLEAILQEVRGGQIYHRRRGWGDRAT